MTNISDATTPTGVPGGPQPVSLEYVPQPGLGGLAIKNFLLTVITLGIYSFWGKTNVRRHLWSCIHLMDEPLEYTGTGKELFLGMLIVSLIIVVPLAALQFAIGIMFPGDLVAEAVAQGLVLVVLIYLIGVGIYRARRYRLSRTVWRGIRGTLSGSPWAYAWSNFWMTFTLPLSLLWTYPWVRTRLNSRITNEMEFGTRPFAFSGGAGPLYTRFAVLWIGGIITLVLMYVALSLAGLGAVIEIMLTDPEGLEGTNAYFLIGLLFIVFLVVIPFISLLMAMFRAVYVSGEMNYFAACTSYDSVQFKMNATTGSLIGLVVGNFFIVLFTLGIAMPFAQQRLIRYVCNRMTLTGVLNVDAIQQSQAQLDRRGEGLAEAFDIDAF